MSDEGVQAELQAEASTLSSMLRAASIPVKRMLVGRSQPSSHAGFYAMLAKLDDGGEIGLWLDQASGGPTRLFWCGLYYASEIGLNNAVKRAAVAAKPKLSFDLSHMLMRPDIGLVPREALTPAQMASSIEERLSGDGEVEEYYLGRYFIDYSAQAAISYLQSPMGNNPLPSAFWEGKPKQRMVDYYERDPKAREECLKRKKPICCVCEIDFGEVYGEIGEGYIHVHHLVPLAKRGGNTKTSVADLVPVCPNCHAMLHSQWLKSPDDLKRIMAEQSSRSS